MYAHNVHCICIKYGIRVVDVINAKNCTGAGRIRVACALFVQNSPRPRAGRKTFSRTCVTTILPRNSVTELYRYIRCWTVLCATRWIFDDKSPFFRWTNEEKKFHTNARTSCCIQSIDDIGFFFVSFERVRGSTFIIIFIPIRVFIVKTSI